MVEGGAEGGAGKGDAEESWTGCEDAEANIESRRASPFVDDVEMDGGGDVVEDCVAGLGSGEADAKRSESVTLPDGAGVVEVREEDIDTEAGTSLENSLSTSDMLLPKAGPFALGSPIGAVRG